MVPIKKVSFNASLVLERSITSTVEQLGKHDCTMELWANDAKISDGYASIEWDIPSLDECTQIGIWINHARELTDYDGIFSLPDEAIQLLRDCGITVGPEFEDN